MASLILTINAHPNVPPDNLERKNISIEVLLQLPHAKVLISNKPSCLIGCSNVNNCEECVNNTAGFCLSCTKDYYI